MSSFSGIIFDALRIVDAGEIVEIGSEFGGTSQNLESHAAAMGGEYGFAEIPGVFGLGVIFALDAPWSGAMADHLVPFHHNPLLAALEANRLANYLHVFDIQDRLAA